MTKKQYIQITNALESALLDIDMMAATLPHTRNPEAFRDMIRQTLECYTDDIRVILANKNDDPTYALPYPKGFSTDYSPKA